MNEHTNLSDRIAQLVRSIRTFLLVIIINRSITRFDFRIQE